jgi:5'-AMP-activated protein kinase regulatory gamma subunit
MNSTLLPTTSPKVRRKASTRRARAASFLPPQQNAETFEAALSSIRTFLKARISYDAFPVSFRIIVLDSKLEVKKALQCLLTNGECITLCSTEDILTSACAGVVSAPLWNSDTSCFAGMLTVQDIIHLIQWYYKNASTWDNVTSDVESFRLESLRGPPIHLSDPARRSPITPSRCRESTWRCTSSIAERTSVLDDV